MPASLSTMPNFRRSLGRWFLLIGSTPVLLLLPFLWTLAMWLVLQAFGYIGSPLVLAQAVGMPPLSVSSDLQNALVVLGQPGGVYAALPALLLRTILVGLLAGLVVETLHDGRPTILGVLDGIRGMPVIFGALVLNLLSVVALAFAVQLGPGLGSLVQVALPAVALWLLGFVPFVAVTERRGLSSAIQRSVLGARTPGGRHFLFSLLYLLLLTFVQVLTPGAATTANPGIATWAFILVVNYVHVGFFAAFGYRWLVVRHSVPEPAARAPVRVPH